MKVDCVLKCSGLLKPRAVFFTYWIVALVASGPALVIGFERLCASAGARGVLAVVLGACAIVGPWRGQSRLESAQPDVELISMKMHPRQVIPERDALIVAAGDPSPSIYL